MAYLDTLKMITIIKFQEIPACQMASGGT